MKKTQIIVYQEYIKEVIKSLHESGLMEIRNIAKEDPHLLETANVAKMPPEVETLANYELRLTRIIDILKKTKKSQSGIKAMLKPSQVPEPQTIEETSIDELFSRAEGILQSIEKHILSFEEKIQTLDDHTTKIKSHISQLEYFKDFDVNISDLGETEYIVSYAGKTSDYPQLKHEVEQIEYTTISCKKFGTGKQSEWSVLIVAHNSVKDAIAGIVKEYVTVFNFPDLKGSPKSILKNLSNELVDIEKEKKQIHNKLQQYQEKSYYDLLTNREEIQLERMRKEISKNFGRTTSTYILQGWVLEKKESDLKELVEKVTKGHAVLESETPKANPDNPPIYLETPTWAKSFKTFLELFATPKYNELNPTLFMGIFFVLFFGLMLGDAGYGLVLLLLSLVGYIKYGKHSSLILDWSKLGIMLGITTTVVGICTNGFFGDLLPRFFHITLPTMNVLGVRLPLDPLRDPLTILTIALIAGIIHLNLGIILGMVQSLHNKDYKTFFTKHFNWIPMQLGGGLLIGTFIMDWQIEGVVFYLAIGLTLVGIILLFLHSGPIGFFDITGYVGDWLSYARLLALGLATAGMALAFNVVAELMGNMIPYIGIAITIIILIFAHLVNLALQALGAGVHSLRLQYVEFFNRFYEGGGRTFSPFKIKRRYTKLKEE